MKVSFNVMVGSKTRRFPMIKRKRVYFSCRMPRDAATGKRVFSLFFFVRGLIHLAVVTT